MSGQCSLSPAALHQMDRNSHWGEGLEEVEGVEGADGEEEDKCKEQWYKKQTNDEGMEERLQFRAKMLQSAVGRPGSANVRATQSGMDMCNYGYCMK